MYLFFTDVHKTRSVGDVTGLSAADVVAVLGRSAPIPGTPVLLSKSMLPVEPLCSWFRELSLNRRSVKTMRAYAYTALILLRFLRARDLDLSSAAEQDVLEFRRWRLDDGGETVSEAAWDRDAAAIGCLYDFLVRQGVVARRPWRNTPRRQTSLASRTRRDLRVRHIDLQQYLHLRDVGFGGIVPDGGVDDTFRGWRPHRNRAACELALLTGMRLQEWSTLLLPELGLIDGRSRSAHVGLGACAKSGHPRSVYVPTDAMDLLDPYLRLERAEIVAKAQKSLRRARQDLFVVRRLEADGTRVSGILDGHAVTRSIRAMDPGLRRIAVRETGDGLDPLALFVGTGGRMLTASGWDRVRWAAWSRMTGQAVTGVSVVLPRRCWVYHDLRHTFALRLLIYLTRLVLDDDRRRRTPMSTLLDHMSGNPLLQVQRRLGHASPSTTYRYIRYLKDPMREVDQAFQDWTVAGGATYADIAGQAMTLGGDDATQG
ncbi:tyrosine-type recombinase/integrase [Actinoplanes couchii]|uniref:Core-binding (CB) domain-containing protein n=1 Tax=Actinoplanes couchii TaxID=403638 RepID=A0ABQ3XHW1_9ACTN|nr:site-specific integrase [Actinoplanes couchii]MDR6317706.1 site-specific recombinase XerD [Actinoplanes couchii]GID58090.1 hypothetical protein Aco03nite_064940 [Actinoplanes couchii]